MTKKKTAPKRSSTALAKRAPQKKAPLLRPVKTPRSQALETAAKEDRAIAESLAHTLGEEIAIADFGLVEVKFTKEEEAALSEPVRFEDMRVKPTGAVYLPHPVYTRWLNRAFGRTGWALRPASKPLLNHNTVVIPYLLMVHGKPVAFALGEQEFFENNKDQSWGDALESTQASALRRTCKHLGLGLELWDKSFNDMFLEEHCVKVWNEKKNRYEWRRTVDPPFFWEKETRKQQRKVDPNEHREPARTVEPVAHHGKADEKITDQQKMRLWTIARRHGRDDNEVKRFIESFGYHSSGDIKRKDYENIVAALEHPGPLVLASSRIPGEDG